MEMDRNAVLPLFLAEADENPGELVLDVPTLARHAGATARADIGGAS